MGDEKQARHILAEMQVRLSRSAFEALGINEGASEPERVHAVFLELAKTYHPQKFARMAPDIQRLANEVFLSLRAAHDSFVKPKLGRLSGPIPNINNKTPAPELVRPTPTGWRQSSTPTGASPPVTLDPPTVRGGPPKPSSAIDPPTARGGVQNKPPAPASSINAPTAREKPPLAPTRPGTNNPAQVRRMTPPGGVPATHQTGQRPAISQPTPSGGVPAAKPAVEPELVAVYEQLERNQWKPARDTLNALIAHCKALNVEPKPRYLALLKYSEAREAQVAGDIRGASIDLEAALKLDKDLQVAKTALGELFARRK